MESQLVPVDLGDDEGVSAAAFDRSAAANTLASAATSARSCASDDGPAGPGHISVVFAPSGAVRRVSIDAPYAGTSVGACVAGRFRLSMIPAFSGGDVTVGKSFTIGARSWR